MHALVAYCLVLQLATPIGNPTPVPTPHPECILVPVAGATPRVCCMWVHWQKWGDNEPERIAHPIDCGDFDD